MGEEVGTNGKSEIAELIARCQAVGWSVTKTNNSHWKVDTRKGIFTMPSTPTSPRAYANSLADARRHGLEELEERLGKRTETQRQAKIAADRAINDAKLARMEQKVREFSKTGHVEFREPKADPTVDLGFGFVNGIAIVAVAPAMIKTPITEDAHPMRDAEELLLANEAIVYRCRKIGPWGSNDDVASDQMCQSVFSSARSLQSHISFHTRRALRNAADAADAIDAATQEKERRVEEVVKTINKVEATVAVIAPNATTDVLKSRLTESLTTLVAAVDRIGAASIEARNSILQLVDLVKEMKPEIIVQEPDPELVAKAAQFDQLAATLGSLIKPIK